MNCQNCNTPIPEGSVFCPNCGTKVEAPQAEHTVPQEDASYCANCGEKLAPGSAFCPNCGTAQASTSGTAAGGNEKKPTGGKKLPLGILGGIAGGIVVAAVALVLILTGAFKSDAGQFRTIMEKALVDPVVTTLESADTEAVAEISTDMTVSLEAESDSIAAEYLDDTSITVKVDADKNGMLSQVDLTLMGSDILSATVTYADGVAGLYLPDLDNEYYTFAVQEFINNLSGEEIDLGLENEAAALDTKQAAALWARYAGIVLDIVSKDNVSVEKKQTVELIALQEEIEKCTVYTFEPTEEDIEAMLIVLADTLRDDKELEAFVSQPALAELLAIFMYGEPVTLSGMDVDLEDVTDEFLGALEDAADELEDNAADIAEMVVDADFCIRAAVQGTDLVEIAICADGGEVRLEVNGSEKEGLTYCLAFGEDDEVYGSFKLYYEVNGSTALGEISAESYDEEFVSLRFEADTKNKSALGIYHGEYRLDVEELGTPILLTVEATDAGTTHTLRVKDLAALDYYLDDMSDYFGDELAVTIATTDDGSTAEAPGREPTDITGYDEDELYEIVSAWEEELSTLFADIAF